MFLAFQTHDTALARSCLIADQSDTSLNVRDSPNGKVINRLRNGRQVEIGRTSNDGKRRPWGFATGQYQGKNRNWGWVFMEAINCGEDGSKRIASSGEFDSRIKDFWRADGILIRRGFSPSARLALLNGVIFDQYANDGPAYQGKGARWSKRAEGLLKELGQRVGQEHPSVMVYTDHSPDTGRKIQRKTFSRMAETVSRCMRRDKPWADCKLNYHPVDGCFLKKEQRVFCSGRSGDKDWKVFCWNYEKGPGIQLPYQATAKSQIKLAAVAGKKRATASKRKKKPVINPRGRPLCKIAYANGPACLSSDEGC